MKKLLILFILISVLPLAKAQKSIITDYRITGYTRSSGNAMIPFANILLYNSADSAMVSGVTANESGKFEIRTPAGNYYLKISFISYETIIIPDLVVKNTDIDLGGVVMVEKTAMIDEVVVTGEKSQLQLSLEKKVFNIGSDITSMGGSAADVLNKVPSVAVESDGTVTLRGSQNVRILVDGKPSGLIGLKSTDALRQLQGDIIEKVEVITNPSAKFDATGEVGIINLVLKKNKNKGLNGTFSANTGYPFLLEGSYSINYRKDKLNFFSNYGITNRYDRGRGSTYQAYNGTDTSFAFTEISKNRRQSLSQNFTFGIDYFFSEKSILTGSLIYENSNETSKNEIAYSDYSINDIFLQSYKRNETEKANENNLEAALGYRKKFDREGQELTFDLKWMQNTEPEKADIAQFNPAGENVLNEKSGTGENEYNYLLQADYVHPYLDNGKLETGIKSNLRFVKSDYFLERLDDNGEWIAFPEFTDNLDYVEKISAAYIMTSFQVKSFEFQAGVRSEYSDITSELKRTGERNHRTYLDFFPSANISYKMNESNTFQVSYSRRLNRPNFRDLLPYNGFGDSRILMQGNPDLNPEYTDSYETAYLFENDIFNIMATAYYRYRTGVIQRFSSVDQSGITHIKPINISVQHVYGMENNFDLQLNKVLRLNSDFNFYKAVMEGKYESQDFSTTSYSWINRSSLSLRISKLEIQSSLNYRAPRNTPQGKELASWYVDSGVRRDLFKGKGTLALNIRDLFNSRKRSYIVNSEGLYSRSEHQFRMRQVLLTFSYRLKRDNNGRGHGGPENGPGGETIEY